MNYILNWLLPKQVIYLQYSGNISIANMQTLVDEILQALATVPSGERAIIINNMSNVTSFDVDLPVLQRMTRAISTHPKLESIVIVGIQDIATQMTFTILSRIGQLPLKFVETNEDAYQWLTHQSVTYATLPPPLTWTETAHSA